MNGEDINDVEKDENNIWWGVKPMNVEVNGDEIDEEMRRKDMIWRKNIWYLMGSEADDGEMNGDEIDEEKGYDMEEKE